MARELIEFLQQMPPNTRIHFEGLTYYRLKQRGPDLVQIEFGELIDEQTDTHIKFRKCPL